jgi:hypothetical protein
LQIATKSGALPAVLIVDRVLERDRQVLEDIAADLQGPTQHDRVVAAACGIYRCQPQGVPTWSGYKQSERLDISWPRCPSPPVAATPARSSAQRCCRATEASAPQRCWPR